MVRKLTHNQMQRYRECPRRYYYEYVRLLRPTDDNVALKHGTMQHKALELLETSGEKAAVEYLAEVTMQYTNGNRFIPATIAATTRAYKEYYKDHPIVDSTLFTECQFTIPLESPDGTVSRTWRLAGKIDRIVRLVDGRNAILETKTSGDTPDEKYFMRLMMDSQISLYLMAARIQWPDLEIDTIVYDVIRKPSMKPYLATPIEKRRYTKDGRLYASDREFDETPEQWQERLYADILERPAFYLCRREVPRLLQEIDTFKDECWNWSKLIRESELRNRWGRNVTRMCENCPHFSHCCGVVDLEQSPIPDGFQKIEDEHPELKGQ